MRARVGRLLRRWADRINPANAPRWYTPYTFTVEPGGRPKMRSDMRGARIYYVGRGEHEKAYAEADHDWRSPDEKLAAMLATHGETRKED